MRSVNSPNIAASGGKLQELRLREEGFLGAAQELLLEGGYHGLTMARVAERTGFSKGTVYNRFPCKEDLVAELGVRIRARRTAMIERAMTFAGNTRERMVAIGEAAEHFAKLYPAQVRVLNILGAEAVLEKVSAEQRARIAVCDMHVLSLIAGLVREAIACGDLKQPPRTSPESLAFALAALVEGGAALALGGHPLEASGVGDPYSAIARGCHLLLDGAGWKPLSTKWDYSATSRRIKLGILSEEARAVSAGSAPQGDTGKAEHAAGARRRSKGK